MNRKILLKVFFIIVFTLITIGINTEQVFAYRTWYAEGSPQRPTAQIRVSGDGQADVSYAGKSIGNYGSITVEIGTTLSIQDKSVASSGYSITDYDFQIKEPDGSMSGRMYNIPASYTVTQEGNYQFFLCVADNRPEEENGNWKNWSDNGGWETTGTPPVPFPGCKWYFTWFVVHVEDTGGSEDPPPSGDYTLTMQTDGHGSTSPAEGTHSCEGNVSISATPNAGYEFDHWEGNGGIANEYISSTTINVDRDRTAKACFKNYSGEVADVFFSFIDNASENPIGHRLFEDKPVGGDLTYSAPNPLSEANWEYTGPEGATWQLSSGEINPVTVVVGEGGHIFRYDAVSGAATFKFVESGSPSNDLKPEEVFGNIPIGSSKTYTAPETISSLGFGEDWHLIGESTVTLQITQSNPIPVHYYYYSQGAPTGSITFKFKSSDETLQPAETYNNLAVGESRTCTAPASINAIWGTEYILRSSQTNPYILQVTAGNLNPEHTFWYDEKPANTYTLTVNIAGTGTGTVTKNPDKATYSSGETVTLTAVAGASSTFIGWSGDANGTNTATTVTMNSDKTITATFNEEPSGGPYTISISTSGTGTVDETGTTPENGIVNAGDQCNAAIRFDDTAYEFVAWQGDIDGGTQRDHGSFPGYGRIMDIVFSDMDRDRHVVAVVNAIGEDPPGPDPPDPPPSGSGDIVFTPDNTAGYTPRGWARQSVPVTVSIPSCSPQVVEDQVTWGYRVYNWEVVIAEGELRPEVPDDPETPESEYIAPLPNSDAYGWVPRGAGFETVVYSQQWSLSGAPIQLSGSSNAKVANGGSVVLSPENANHSLTGIVGVSDWVPGSINFTPPSLPAAPEGKKYEWEYTPDPDDTPPPNITYSGTSGGYQIDKTTPTIGFSPSSRNWQKNTSKSPISVYVSLNDNLSGVYSAKYKWSTSSGKPGGGWSNLSASGGTVSKYQQGTWYLHVEIEDTAGWTKYSYSGPYRYDASNPSISVNMSSRDWIFNSSISKQPVNVNVTITDNNSNSGSSGIDYSQYKWTNTTASPASGWINLPNKNGGTVSQAQEGVWYLHVRTEDTAGWTQQICKGPYKIDLTEATASVNIPNQSWTNVPYDVVLSVSDPFISYGPNPINPSILLNTTWNIENRSYYNYLPDPSSGNFIQVQSGSNTIPIDQNGAYKVTVNLKDGANNDAGTVYYPTTGVPDSNHDKYLYDEYPPYVPVFSPVDGTVKNITLDDNSTIQVFDYVADQSNKVRVTVGDDLSGLGPRPGQTNDYAWFAWSKSPTKLTEGSWNVLGGIGSNEIFDNPFSQKTPGQDIRAFDINVHSSSIHTANGQGNWDYLKEGLWYLHIKQKDRAGNVSSTIAQEAADIISGASPGYFQRVNPQPVFINKIKNLRVTVIYDPAWDHYFRDKKGNPAELSINGIRTSDMPIYCNKEYSGIKLGYKLIYKLNVVGLDKEKDTINIHVKYHALEKGTKILHTNVGVYIPQADGDYVRIEDGKYNSFAQNIQIKPITDPDYVRQINYEENSDIPKQGEYQRDLAKNKYSTYEAEIFLPPTAKFVTRDEEPDFISETNIHDYKLLCTFEISGNREGTGTLDYTLKEDKWGENYVWFTGVNDYGKNRRTSLDLVNKGVNHGEVFWYNLQQTLMDDLKHGRTW